LETIAAALDLYGRGRMASGSPGRRIGVEAVLEIVASFCDEAAEELLDPFSRRRLARSALDEDGVPACHLLPAVRLIRLLAPCARLFPYHIVAGSGVIAAFRGEAPRLALWLHRQNLATREEHAEFVLSWTLADDDIARQLRLQRAVERALAQQPRFVHRGEAMAGRFRVDRVDHRGLWVNAGATVQGPIKGPSEMADFFAAGLEASLAFQRAAIGWALLATSLPCECGGLQELLTGSSPGDQRG
jgi:hypothetical protein